MSGAMVVDMVDRLLGDRVDDASRRQARGGVWLSALWDEMAALGLPFALVPEEKGGFGLPIPEALEIVRLVGLHALPLPLAETMVANHLLAHAGLPLADGPAALCLPGDSRVAWGRKAEIVVAALGDGRIARVAAPVLDAAGTNMAGMPRDRVSLAVDVAPSGAARVPVLLAGATIRTLQIAGALERVLQLTIAYVSEREQFGRPLARFQAVQHGIATLAGEVAAACAAADMAAEAFAEERRLRLPVAAARVRVGEAVGVAAGIAHQLHGAIGFTEEHRLHHFTTALWSWRDEFGAHGYWVQQLGQAALDAGGAGFWAFVTEAA